MPTFGEYETIGEPIATIEERGHLTTVWQARKTGASGAALYVVKCYAPHRAQAGPGQAEAPLDKDQGLEFLEGIKQQKKAQSEGGRCLAPIHAFGLADLGAWYVTDFYPRNNLRALVGKRVRMDNLGLRHVIHSVVTGCLALKRSRGHSHGNLKAANVYLVGAPRALRQTPLHLTDPYPAAPLQLSKLDPNDKQIIGELLGDVVEVQDLKAIGELILQLVESRLVTNAYDYNYPIGPSKAWEAVGKEGENWRKLCNQLLDPQLSLSQVNLEALEREFRPTVAEKHLPLILGTLGMVVLLAGGGYVGISYFKAKAKQREDARKAQEQAALQVFDKSVLDGNALVEQANYPQAAIEFQNAVKSAAELNDPARKKAADEYERYASALAQAKAAARVEDELRALDDALGIKKDARIQAWFSEAQARKDKSDNERRIAQAKTDLERSLASGNTLLAQTNYAEAAVEFQKAFKAAGELNDPEKKKAADEGQRYASALAQARAAGGAADEIKSLEEALKIRKDPKVAAWLDDAKQRKAQGEIAKTAAQQRNDLEKALAAGDALLAQTNYAQATVEFNKAAGIATGLNEAEKKKAASEGQRFSSALAQAKSASRVEDEIKSLEDALKIRKDPKVEAWLADANKRKNQGEKEKTMAQKKTDLDAAMAEGNRFLAQPDYAKAAIEFQKASKLAGDLGDLDKKKNAEESQRFATALAQAKASEKVEDEIKFLDEALKIRKDPKVDALLADAKLRKDQLDRAMQKQKDLDAAIAEGNRLLDRTDYAQATAEFKTAGKIADDLKDAAKKKTADDGQRFANALTQAKAATGDDEIKWLQAALQIRSDPRVQARLAAAQRAKPIVTTTTPTTPGTHPAKTNLFGLEFAWVPGVRTNGAYVALTELSHSQFRAVYDQMNLDGSAQWRAVVQSPSNPLTQFAGTEDDFPITLRQEQAFELVKNLNKQGKYPGRFVLPILDDFLVFAQVGPNVVDPSTGKFAGNGDLARKTFGDTKLFWTGIGATTPGERGPRKVKEGVANGYGLFNAIGNGWEWSEEAGAALGLSASSEGRGPSATLKRAFFRVTECISARLMFIPGQP